MMPIFKRCNSQNQVSKFLVLYYVKRKNAFEQVQNAQIQIIQSMGKVSSACLCFQGRDQTRQIGRLIWAFAVPICLKTPFCMVWLIQEPYVNDTHRLMDSET